MKHLSALKKQYREDLENLTHAYEGRRKILKEAMLLYAPATKSASTASTEVGGSSSNSKHSHSKSKASKTRADEKG